MRNAAMKTALKSAMKPVPGKKPVSRYAKPDSKQDPFRSRARPLQRLPLPIPMSEIVHNVNEVLLESPPPLPPPAQPVTFVVELPSVNIEESEPEAQSQLQAETPEAENATDNWPQTFKDIDVTPAAPPANPLSWLDKKTPATEVLKVFTAPARDRKTAIAVEMESLRKQHTRLTEQIAGLEKDRYEIEFRMEVRREDVKKIDDMLEACALLVEQAAGIESLAIKGPERRAPDRRPQEVTYSSDDCYQYFLDHPEARVTSDELVANAPPHKRDSAKASYAMRVGYLLSQGKISRAGHGVYTLAKVN